MDFFDPASALLGALIGTLISISLVYPRVARIVAKLSSVVLLGLGAGLMTWGLFTAIRGEKLPQMAFGPLEFANTGQVLGWAAGCLAAGTTALVLSFVGRHS